MKPDRLMEFYNELIIKQDYFECHEIMEEAWKRKASYTKNDREVFLILIATAEYHYRRNNIRGAERSYRRALKLYEANRYDLCALGLENEMIEMMKARMERMTKQGFTPMRFPLTGSTWHSLYAHAGGGLSYHEFMEWAGTLHIHDEAVIHKHRMRDRTEVILEREAAIKKRKHQK